MACVQGLRCQGFLRQFQARARKSGRAPETIRYLTFFSSKIVILYKGSSGIFMPLDPKIFKAYDIRGVYPKELDEKAARMIGRAIVSHLRPVNVTVARDARLSSESLSRALVKGILEQGANVSDIGMVSTDVSILRSAT